MAHRAAIQRVKYFYLLPIYMYIVRTMAIVGRSLLQYRFSHAYTVN